MMVRTRKTHIVPAALLLAVAVLPTSPLWTLGAYNNIETSAGNVFQAGEWGEVIQIDQFSLVLDTALEPIIEGGEVAGTSTEPAPEIEISEPVAPTPEGVGGPTESVGLEISEPIIEITTPPTEETPPAEEEPAPQESVSEESTPE